MREFTAMTQNVRGSTQAVTVRAYDQDDAHMRLTRMGYAKVLWVL
jgi:hypothetical protein